MECHWWVLSIAHVGKKDWMIGIVIELVVSAEGLQQRFWDENVLCWFVALFQIHKKLAP